MSVVIFGENAAAARLPAVMFGVGSIWALYLLARRVAGAREALLASALMTFSYHHVWFSQNARGYTGLLFFGTLATWLWFEALERGSTRRWLAYSATVWLGLWMHMTMIFVVAAHGLVYLALVARRARRTTAATEASDGFWWKPVAAWLFGGTLALHAHALALPEFLRSALHEVSLESEWINPMWVVQESIRRLADGGLAAVVVAAGAITVLGGLASLAQRDWRQAVALVAPGVLGGTTMLALGHNLWPRFFFFCMGFVLILVVRGLIAVPSWIFARLGAPSAARAAQAVGVTACVVGVILSASTLPRSYLPKQDFSGARRYIDEVRRPGDQVVTVGLAALAYERYYAPEWVAVERRADLESIQRSDGTVWLVYTLPVHLEAWLPEVWEMIERDYEIVRVFPGTLGGGDVSVCRWREPRPS
jgi:hypothetical protein